MEWIQMELFELSAMRPKKTKEYNTNNLEKKEKNDAL